MKLQIKVLLFILALIAGIISVALLMDAIDLTEAQEIGMKVGGAVGVGYLVIVASYFIFKQH